MGKDPLNLSSRVTISYLYGGIKLIDILFHFVKLSFLLIVQFELFYTLTCNRHDNTMKIIGLSQVNALHYGKLIYITRVQNI